MDEVEKNAAHVPLQSVVERTAATASTRRQILAGAAAGLLAGGSGAAQGDDYPSRTVTIIAGFAPGGATDVLARLVAQRLATTLGKPFIVQNQTGAGGNIASAAVARAAPDGHTLLMGPGAIAINQTLYKNLPFDVLRDFAPISVVALVPNVLAVNIALAVGSVQDLIAHAKANPGRLNYGSPGIGSVGHLASELFCVMAEVRMTHVPFRGSAPAVTALLGGDIQLMLDNLPPLAPHIEARAVRALAMAGARRHPAYPNLPTIAEAALPGFEATAWQSVLAPAKTPAAIVERLSAEIRQTSEDAEFRKKIELMGAIPYATTPQEFQAFLAAEVDKWGKVVKSSGATLN